MIVLYRSHITRKDTKNNPNTLFIFGDNDKRSGYGGLAKELRGAKNAIGIRVKKKPSLDTDAFYTDVEIKENMEKICADINKIIDKINSGKYDTIIYPSDGIGTGLAQMKQYCPETFNNMNLILEGTLDIRNG
jgi:hypothetical protein